MSRPAAVPPASKAETHPCKVCSVPTTMRCSRCAEAWYCSKEHIAEVWRLHKPTCYPRGTVQAILFPVDEDKPRMVTVEYWIEPPDEEDVMPSKSHRLNLKPWLGRTESVDLNRHGIEGPPIGRTLRLIWGDCHLKDGSKSNRSILRATKGLQVHNWAGNIMAFRAVEPYQYIAQVKDAVMEEDLEPIIAYFSEYRRILPRSLYQYVSVFASRIQKFC
ncbi:hypothetical protein PLICRDRAFT_109853 [Plicaturopsis crispa FD-325 SS-3]|nr:hypothetical protein PLICRDRAFT_109853 [Plicaturopsis crispa FD-325 SS-3]